MFENTLYFNLFLVCFCLEILVVSFYFPYRNRRYLLESFRACPPSEYPRLYPRPVDKDIRSLNGIAVLSMVLGAAGLLLAFMIAFLNGSISADEKAADFLGPVIIYGIVQVFPNILAVSWLYKRHKLMQEQDTRKIRRASLTPRRFSDVVPGIYWILPLAVYGAMLLLSWFYYLNTAWGRYDTWDMLSYPISCGVMLALMLLAGAIQWRNTTVDPYQTSEQHAFRLRMHMRCLSAVTTAAIIFLMLAATREAYDLKNHPLTPIFLCLHLLVINILFDQFNPFVDPENKKLAVYRANGTVE